MWIIITILVVGAILFFANQQHRKEIIDANLERGGFRKAFPLFTHYLENVYKMSFINDTGKDFFYSKQINNIGLLIIGVKLDLRDEPCIYSKLKDLNGQEFKGETIVGIDFSNINSIERSLQISINRLLPKGVISIEEPESIHENTSLEKWRIFSERFENKEHKRIFRVFITKFYIPDKICIEKFSENLNILRFYLQEEICVRGQAKKMENFSEYFEDNYGTISIREMRFICGPFSIFFLAAYPDAYTWYIVNYVFEKERTIEKISSEQSENIAIATNFYRSIIDKYTKTGNHLECVNS